MIRCVTPVQSGGAISRLASSRVQSARPEISMVPPSTKQRPLDFARIGDVVLQGHVASP